MVDPLRVLPQVLMEIQEDLAMEIKSQAFIVRRII
jgi:hypothetical protein